MEKAQKAAKETKKRAGAPSKRAQSRLRGLLNRPMFVAGLVLLVVVVLAAIFADVIAPHGYADQDLAHRLEVQAPSIRLVPTSTVAASSAV